MEKTEQEVPHAGVSRAIIDKFGGVTELSRELKRAGHNVSQTTISGWNASIIPERWRPVLIALAAKEGIPHVPADYVDYLKPFAANGA